MKQNQFKRKYLRIATLLLAIVFTAQACGLGRPARQEQIELNWWKPFDDPQVIQPLVQEFQKAYPNTRINYVQKNVDTYEDELIDALAAGKGPDIFSIHNDWLPKHQDKLTPAPVKVYSLREFKDSFLEVASFDLIADDKIYAVPLATDVLVLYYNKDILASTGIVRPPATWEELVNMTPKLTRQDRLGNFDRSAIALGTADNINRSPDILGLLMLQNGTAFYSPDRLISNLDQTVRDEAGNAFSPAATALEFYTQFANPSKVTYTWNSKSNNSIEAFANGQVAMIFSYSYLRDNLSSRAPFLNYGIAPAPQIDVNKNKINFANYWAEGVAKQSAHPDAAWQFLKFISGKDALPKYYEVKKQPSSRPDIIEKQISDPDIGVFAENALSARSFYKPDAAAVESIFVQMINDVVLRNVPIKDAISAASQKINLILRNR